MTSTYAIQKGDTLLQIAIDNGVEFTDILAINPQLQINPDHIRVGDTLNLPNQIPVEAIEPDYPIEPPQPSTSDCGEIISAPECKGIEVSDVVFVTGDSPTAYYCLTEAHHAKLKEEITFTEQLIQGYKELLESAPQGDHISTQDLEKHALKKKVWLENAVYAGAIKVSQPEPAVRVAVQAEENTTPNKAYIESKIRTLETRRAIVDSYVPYFSDRSTITVRDKVIKSIDIEITYWQMLLQKTPSPEKSNRQNVDLNNFQSGTFKHQPASRHVVEIWLASENRLVYIRADFYRDAVTRWHQNPIKTAATKALADRDWKGLKQAFVTDIKQGITNDFDAKKLETVFASWDAEGWKAHEWKATQKLHDEDGQVVFAATQEAQLMRFAAQASVKSILEPTNGKIDIGIGAEASFALAEGAVGFKRYLPYEKGYSVTLSYLDANKQPANYPFGCFRANVSLMLSCFVGFMANGRVSISNQAAPNPNPGHEILLAPSISMGETPSGGVGVNAEIFGGAQAGGQVEGALEWKAPPDTEQDKIFDFETLAKVGANGNVAIGAGAGWDFNIDYDKESHEFIFGCSGKLVFGPGASGGFGTVIQFDQLWRLTIILLKGLQCVDYRVMTNISENMYEHIVNSSYAAFAAEFIEDPKEALRDAVIDTHQQLKEWWLTRRDNWNDQIGLEYEARRLANNIISSQGFYNAHEIALDQLPPETVGIMLNTLVSTFYTSREEKQETAIYIIFVGMVKSWRRFEEILVHMNPEGTKQSGDKAMFDNLARINAILDGDQQHSFNNWVAKLAQVDSITADNFAQLQPFKPKSGYAFQLKYPLIENQISQLKGQRGNYYV